MKNPWDDYLPISVEIAGQRYTIRTDYRDILNIFAALNDPELDGQDRAIVLLGIFYPDLDQIPPEHYEEAIRQCFCFIDCGNEKQAKSAPKLVDWEQDFRYIVAPINRVAGREIRKPEPMHWWTFLACYYEIGDCLFAQIVRIRNLLAKGKPLDKSDRQWYRENRELVDIKVKYTEAEDEVLQMWGAK